MAAGAIYPDVILAWWKACPPQEQEQRAQALWESVSDELSPLLGALGVATLLGRCQCMCRGAFPWLEAADGSCPMTADWRQLMGRMDGRAPHDTLAANRMLFIALHELMQVLIGASLTAGVLEAAWIECKRRLASGPWL